MLYLFLPFLVAAAAAGLSRLAGGPGRGVALAGIAVPAGFLAAWLVLRGLPPLPPRGSLAQVPYVALAGLLVGSICVLLSIRRGALLAVVVGFSVLAVWAALGFATGWSWLPALKAAALLAAWLLVLLRLEGRAAKEPTAPVMLAMLAVGIGVVALVAGEPLWARLGFAMAAAAAGFLAWSWAAGFPFLLPAVLGGAGGTMALGGAAAVSGALPWPALAVLLLVPFADGTAARLPSGSGLVRRLLQPLLLALTCLLPIVLGAALAYVALHVRLR